jgi:apolipoprotein N-acyltransferase
MAPALLAAILSGSLLALAFPKWDFTWLLPLALLPACWALRGKSGKAAFWLGFVHGLAFYLVLLYWISYVTHVFGKLPLILAFGVLTLLAAYLSLYRALWGWGVAWADRRGVNLLWFAPAWWAALEFAQTYVISGFPWELLGHGLYRQPLLLQVADLTGVYGLSALVVLVNVALYRLLAPGPRLRRLTVVTVLVVAAAAWVGYGYVRLGRLASSISSSPKLPVAVVQGNIKQGDKWDPKMVPVTLELYGKLTDKVLEPWKGSGDNRGTPLVVWPETAAPYPFGYSPGVAAFDNLIREIARKNHAFLLFGAPASETRPGGDVLFNRAYLVSPEGKQVGYYDKAHLVPYGEYVPLKRIFFFIHKMVQAIGDFEAGPVGAVVRLPEAPVGVLICYESIFGYLSRAQTQNGARLLVNITNDAWFGDTGAPYQHMSMAVIRTVENRVALARAANTGISAFINPDGRILWTSGLNIPAAHALELPLLAGGSLYTRYGDVFAWACVALCALALLFTRGRRR